MLTRSLRVWPIFLRCLGWTQHCSHELILVVHQVHATSLRVMFIRRTLNRIGNGPGVWIRMPILICYHSSSIYMYAIFRTHSRISDRATLTTLEFWIWHTFVVVLIRIVLNILEINWIAIWLSRGRSWTLHQIVVLVIRCYSLHHSHSWIMLVEWVLAHCYLMRISILQHWLFIWSIIGRMKRMNWPSTLSG